MAAPVLDKAAVEALRLQSMVQEASVLGDWLVIMPVAIPFVFGALIVMLRSRVDRHADLALAAFLLMRVLNLGLLLKVARDGIVVMEMSNWLPPFGIAFAVDAVGALFALATSVVGVACTLYANAEITQNARRYGFFAFLLFLSAGVSGAFLTGDIFNLYVWFEVLLISSFGLIIYGGEKVQLDGAVKYAVLNLLATTLFLIATGLLYGLTGTLNFADLSRVVPTLALDAPVLALAALFLLAFGMKAAAFPAHFWLAASYHTPHPIAGAIFAGLLTKVCVYALFRTFSLVFAPMPPILMDILSWVAMGTMLLGVFGALAQNDVRRLLGFLVISGIGSMLLGLALGTSDGLFGALIYAIHSIIVMTALYLTVGAMEKLTGSSRLTALGGVYQASPLLAAMMLVLVVAVSGLPPFSGFWPKLAILSASLAVDENLAAGVFLFSSLLTSIAMGRVWALAFWRPTRPVSEGGVGPLRPASEAITLRHKAGLALLLLFVVGLGLFPEAFVALAQTGAAGLIDPSAYVAAVLEGRP